MAALAAVWGAAVAASMGCGGQQRAGDATVPGQARQERLGQVEARLDRLEEQVAQIAQTAEQLNENTDKLADLSNQIALLKAEVARDTPAPRRPRVRRPDPNVVYSVPVAGSPFEGPARAKVTIVEAFEFACPFCERSRATMRQVRKHYGKDVRIVYKSFLVHPQIARTPALAACAAAAQGKFSPMKEAIWEKGFKAGRNLSEDNMMAIARELRLNVRRFKRDMNGDACAQQIQQEQAMMSKVGTRGTPTFYINGRVLPGAQPFSAFKALIDEELAKANRAIRKQGIKQRDYYEHLVETGRKSL